MSFDDCKTKIQQMSNLLKESNYPEQILNCRDIDMKEDFQYMCLNSTVNSDLVNEVIARLAQNGNRALVEDNLKCINMGMWKELFNKNKATKDIFIKNYDAIIENTRILSYREIDKMIDDADTLNLIYGSLSTIIKKLCTYDRAALLAELKLKENGIEQIKINLNCFFEKGEYDISTTYSKVLFELDKVPQLSKVEILESCTKYLSEMLDRETAIDNETNDLLNWIYIAIEETSMPEEKRASMQKKIDEAILKNFDNILDKSNYDKETMRILKQFKCTETKFDNNRNMFIEKSNKLIHMTKIYDLNYEKETKEKKIENMVEDGKILLNFHSTQEAIDYENGLKKSRIDEKDKIIEFSKSKELADHNENNIIELEGKKQETNNPIAALVKEHVDETDKVVSRIMEKSLNRDVTVENKSVDCDTKPFAVIREEEQSKDLITVEDEITIPKRENIFKRLWNAVKNLFSKTKTEPNEEIDIKYF